MSEMDEISRKLLGWYGGKNPTGSSKQKTAGTASRNSPSPAASDTASSKSSPSGTSNSPLQRPLLTLPNKSARKT